MNRKFKSIFIMKRFLKNLLLIVLSTLLTLGLIFFIFIGIIAAASDSDKDAKLNVENAILHIKLDKPLREEAPKNPFEGFDFENFDFRPALSLRQLVKTIGEAKNDENVKGIFLDLSMVQGGIASVEELRNALQDFKSSEKFIVSYSEVYTQKSFYLASVSDEVYLNPAGMVEWRGLATQLMFFKNMLEKLDINVQIIRHGKFKSAVEPFMYDKMSDANRKQVKTYLSSIWGSMTNAIAHDRQLNVQTLNALADSLSIRTAQDAKEYGFVTDTKYFDEIEDLLAEKTETTTDKTNLLKIKEYYYYNKVKEFKEKLLMKKPKIAVVYAHGSIVSGKGEKDELGSETISKAIKEARKDSTVKAIVLRVNSPGGSALASDVIWREVILAKKVKPVVVSMGDVAASGGYFISCAANKIFANENTITGSIGVFGVVPSFQEMLKNKVGITIDTVKTNAHADMGVLRPLTEEEKNIIQSEIEHIYDEFITKVAEGRGMTKAQVDSIGQGRVWSGLDALQIGLVDEIGDLQDAINEAVKLAGIEDYQEVAYPRKKDSPFEFMLNVETDATAKVLQDNLGTWYSTYTSFKKLTSKKQALAQMPYEIIIE